MPTTRICDIEVSDFGLTFSVGNLRYFIPGAKGYNNLEVTPNGMMAGYFDFHSCVLGEGFQLYFGEDRKSLESFPITCYGEIKTFPRKSGDFGPYDFYTWYLTQEGLAVIIGQYGHYSLRDVVMARDLVVEDVPNPKHFAIIVCKYDDFENVCIDGIEAERFDEAAILEILYVNSYGCEPYAMVVATKQGDQIPFRRKFTLEDGKVTWELDGDLMELWRDADEELRKRINALLHQA